ncbi:phage tail sheath subtilisin-like domain-containing protein [Conservatibacter flavescens]|uniref:Phage tail protein n=1 Tax=Conservatibacter flavescens TaxID=28161 RepID=A0A2M8S4Y3_9PAST|nr:phage tail sheath subtilisin-like domain-containing protein [Conservatibacter flavescens]PJG86216.1 phage tail protein [Conservatibacter flavescens]
MSETNITFNNIPASIRVPGNYTEYDVTGAVTALPVNPQEVLIIAPQTLDLNGASYSAPVKVYSDTEAATAFGAGSLAHLMVRQALKNNANMNLTVVGLADHSAGVVAEGAIQVSGTASTAGVLTLVIMGTKYAISTSKGEVAADIARRLNAYINAQEASPVVAKVSGDTITLTAKNKGETGNEISLSYTNTATGVSLTITPMANGQQNADMTDALASVAGTHYNIIVSPFVDTDNANALKEHLEAVSAPTAKKPAIGVMGWRKTLATGTTFTSTLNFERLTVAWYKGCIEPCALIAAGYAAIIASEEDPARPLNTLAVKGLSLVDDSQIPTWAEYNQALYNGLSPLNIVNSTVQIMRAITTYTKSATGVDDPSYLELGTIRSLDYGRKAIEQRLALRFGRSKLVKAKTPSAVRSEILDVMYRLENAEIWQSVDANKAKLICTINAQDDTRIDSEVPADVVKGLHVLATKVMLVS